ncbi:MAG TPA: hypothetical protein VLI39_11110, partial [Sedimentisphaerales bacterium]|nr:hypothetical protein [Sedimentisphaerales bacterium]
GHDKVDSESSTSAATSNPDCGRNSGIPTVGFAAVRNPVRKMKPAPKDALIDYTVAEQARQRETEDGTIAD